MEILKLLEDKGFVADRSWKQKDKNGLMFHSLSNGKFRVEIKEDWNKKYKNNYSNIEIHFLDCEKEFYSNEGFIGWLNQTHLAHFKKEMSKELFEEILKHYNIK